MIVVLPAKHKPWVYRAGLKVILSEMPDSEVEV